MNQLEALATPIAGRFIKSPPAGKHGSYVPHDVITQKALAIVGPHSWEIVEVIRGWSDEVIVNRGKNNERTYPAREAVVGVLGRLTVVVDSREVSIQEPGDAEGAAAQSDGQNAKEAASDAYKRCWMRLGLGLHLWSGPDYELPAMIEFYRNELNGETQPEGVNA